MLDAITTLVPEAVFGGFTAPQRHWIALPEPKITLRNKKVPITHIHEAGHALAYLAARADWGYAQDEIISYIETHDDPPDPSVSAGICWFCSPFPRAWDDVPGNQDALAPGLINREEFYRGWVTRARAAGFDIERWAREYIFGAISGPVAEALYVRKAPWDILMTAQCAGDRGDAGLAFCCWQDIPSLEEHALPFAALLEQMVAASAVMVERNRRGITALALALPRDGILPGKRAAEILAAHYRAPVRAP